MKVILRKAWRGKKGGPKEGGGVMRAPVPEVKKHRHKHGDNPLGFNGFEIL